MRTLFVLLALLTGSLTLGAVCGALATERARDPRVVGASPIEVPPLSSLTVTSSYGWRGGRFHAGVDLRAREGEPLVAVAPGTVAATGTRGPGGKTVVLALDSGWRAGYAHMSRVDVVRGQGVQTGTRIGLAGSTGHATGPHLHFELRDPRGHALVDPWPYLVAARSRTRAAITSSVRATRAVAWAALRTTARLARDRRA